MHQNKRDVSQIFDSFAELSFYPLYTRFVQPPSCENVCRTLHNSEFLLKKHIFNLYACNLLTFSKFLNCFYYSSWAAGFVIDILPVIFVQFVRL